MENRDISGGKRASHQTRETGDVQTSNEKYRPFIPKMKNNFDGGQQHCKRRHTVRSAACFRERVRAREREAIQGQKGGGNSPRIGCSKSTRLGGIHSVNTEARSPQKKTRTAESEGAFVARGPQCRHPPQEKEKVTTLAHSQTAAPSPIPSKRRGGAFAVTSLGSRHTGVCGDRRY